MAPANPLPLDQPVEPLDCRDDSDSRDLDCRSDELHTLHTPEPVPANELNAWRRGFTPQAEIWNGRLAMLGLSVGLTVLLVARLFGSRAS